MSERKVNLHLIIREKWVWLLEEPARELIHDIAKEACRQALELAAEKVLTRKLKDGNIEYYVQSKQSILDIINQVE